MAENSTSTEAYCTTFKHLADMKEHIGKELGVSEWFEVTQQRINDFADVTLDHQWIHIDVEKAKKHSPYKTPIAHGFLVLSLTPKLGSDLCKIEDVIMGINYGTNKVRFINATKVGSLIRARSVLQSFKEIPNGARYVVEMTIEIKGEEKPACYAELVSQVYIDPS